MALLGSQQLWCKIRTSALSKRRCYFGDRCRWRRQCQHCFIEKLGYTNIVALSRKTDAQWLLDLGAAKIVSPDDVVPEKVKPLAKQTFAAVIDTVIHCLRQCFRKSRMGRCLLMRQCWWNQNRNDCLTIYFAWDSRNWDRFGQCFP